MPERSLYVIVGRGNRRWLVAAADPEEAMALTKPLAHLGGVTGSLFVREPTDDEAERFRSESQNWSGEALLAAMPL